MISRDNTSGRCRWFALVLATAGCAACGESSPVEGNASEAKTPPSSQSATRENASTSPSTQSVDTPKTVGALPRVVWNVELEDAKDDYHLQATTLTSDGTQLQVVASVRPRSVPTGERSLLWAATDAKGAIVARRDVLAMLPRAERDQVDLQSPSAGSHIVAAGGETWLLLATREEGYRLLRLTMDRSMQKATVPVALTGPRPTIHDVQPGPGGIIALLGDISGKPFFATIDRAGNVLASAAQVPDDQPGGLSAALFEPGASTAFVVERSSPSGTATQVLRAGQKGPTVSGAPTPGRPLAAARGNGSYAVLTEKGKLPQSELTLSAFDATGLQQRWSQVLVSGHAGGFRIAAMPAGGYVVAGIVNRGLWVSRRDELGNARWTHARRPEETGELEIVTQVDLDASGDECVVTYSAFVIVDREQREVVRSLRFSGA
jgi:hypothetical protein